MDELTGEFLSESRDNLAALDAALLRLEEQPGDRDALAAAFRGVHTIKGTAGFLGYPVMVGMAHGGEDLLGAMREGSVAASHGAMSALFRLRDWLDVAISAIERDGQEPAQGDEALRAAVASAAAGEFPAGSKSAGPPPSPEPFVPPVCAQATPTVPAVDAEEPASVQREATSVRVRTDILERVMEATGRLVVARNRMDRLRGEVSEALLPLLEELDRITQDLREGAVRMRLRPVEEVFARCPRVARDVAEATGKQVEIELHGTDMEMDRAMLEGLRDPLLHCVRNAVDHGIELPDVRVMNGKPPHGKLSVRAAQRGSEIVIEIADDGAGLDVRQLRAKAIRNRLCSQQRALEMSDAEALELIFAPGFSTADSVSRFSGRGVGMDVIRTGIESLGGHVELVNALGSGVTVRMCLPLTLAIFAAQIVRSAGVPMLFPYAALEQVLGVRDFRVDLEAGELYLCEPPLPLIDLRVMAGWPAVSSGSDARVLVVSAAGRSFGILVEAVLNTEQVAIKPLQPCLQEGGVYSGAAMLGTGEIARQLDLSGLLTRWLRERSERCPQTAAGPVSARQGVPLRGVPA